jgi:chitinase
LAPILSRLSHVFYGFVYFCPPADVDPQPYWANLTGCPDLDEWALVGTEPKDLIYIESMVAWKALFPIKVIASLGGWNFPSSYFSMAVKEENRANFVAQIVKFTTTNKLDGVEIDWEYPCSAPRTDPIQITCTKFQHADDMGGDCPDGKYEHGVCSGKCADRENLTKFVQELKEAAPDLEISIAAAASPEMMKKSYDVEALSKVLHHWNLMTYDYYISDSKDSNTRAPN